jgi:CBS domain-containing membrane protein
MVSTLVGVAIGRAVPDVGVAAGLAIGGAILAMSLLRCLHPPGGAAALTVVIGGQGINQRSTRLES